MVRGIVRRGVDDRTRRVPCSLWSEQLVEPFVERLDRSPFADVDVDWTIDSRAGAAATQLAAVVTTIIAPNCARHASTAADQLTGSLAGVVIVPCTTTYRGLPPHVELAPEISGLDTVSDAKREEVKSVSDQRLVARLGTADDEVLFDLSRALRLLVDF